MAERRLKYGFLANHAVLVRRLTPASVLPSPVAENVLTPEDKERISKEASSQLVVDKLLTSVHRRGVNDPRIYDRLLSVLKDPEATSGQNLHDIVRKIEEDSLSEDVEKRFTEEKHVAALKKHESRIASVDVHKLLPNLMSDGVISPEENAAIRSLPNESDQAKELVSNLQKKGLYGFRRFVLALHESDCYQGLVEQLAEADSDLQALMGWEREDLPRADGRQTSTTTEGTDSAQNRGTMCM